MYDFNELNMVHFIKFIKYLNSEFSIRLINVYKYFFINAYILRMMLILRYIVENDILNNL